MSNEPNPSAVPETTLTKKRPGVVVPEPCKMCGNENASMKYDEFAPPERPLRMTCIMCGHNWLEPGFEQRKGDQKDDVRPTYHEILAWMKEYEAITDEDTKVGHVLKLIRHIKFGEPLKGDKPDA